MQQLNGYQEGQEDDQMLRSVYLCDVECPKDLLTAFLLERDAKGNIHHTLHDKVSLELTLNIFR